LEHAVLMGGSRKYPLKEPFVELMKTSVNTFLNAMTSTDHTMYPFASTNLQDFYNLLDIYLDSTFYPNVTPETLMQEGWHLEAENEDAPLTYKGVVFNEMKAAYSTPDRYMSLITDRALWTDTPYQYSSGGFPASIPDLTYEQFKNFHETYYHPSNARFVFSGDDDPDTRLRIVDEFISEFERTSQAEIPLQKPFSEPVVVVDAYDGTEKETGASMVAINWLLPDQTNIKTMTQLSLLSYALVSTQASQLRKALIDSGLGEGLTGSGISTSSRQAIFTVGLKGVKPENTDKVADFILETLGEIAEDGVDKETIKAALNTIEFDLRERNYGRFPRGLVNAMMATRPWIYGGNPIDALSFQADLDDLKQALDDDDELLENLIGEYLLNNSHRVTVTLHPDESVAPAREQAERDRLDKTKDAMNADDIKDVIRVQNELLERQQTPNTPEQLAKIPVLKLDDLDKEISTVEQHIHEHEGARVYFHPQPTGGIIYFQAGFDLRVIDADLLPYVEIFTESLTKLGTDSQDFVRLTQRIGSNTGGVGAGTSLGTKRVGDDYFAYVMVSGKALVNQQAELLNIIKDIVTTVKLDNQERLKQIVLQRKVRMERYLASSGFAVAGARIRAQYTEPAWANEIMSGATHVFFLRELVEKIDNDWDSVLNALERLKTQLINRNGMVVNVTMEESDWSGFRETVHGLISALPSGETSHAEWTTLDKTPYEALTQPAQVSFNAKVANLYDLGYELDGSIAVISKHVSREYIWQNIRVMGGAYGGNMSFSSETGLVNFLSWRDPNISRTLDVFNGTGDYLQQLQLTEHDVEKAIIGAIGSMDGYDLPDAKGRQQFMRHLRGYTNDMRQQFRDQVLSTTLADFHAFGAILAQIADKGSFAVVTAEEFAQKAMDEIGQSFKTTKLQ
ncbi:MAG: insulinase family protein, partial [Chloroflexota bacterium]